MGENESSNKEFNSNFYTYFSAFCASLEGSGTAGLLMGENFVYRRDCSGSFFSSVNINWDGRGQETIRDGTEGKGFVSLDGCGSTLRRNKEKKEVN